MLNEEFFESEKDIEIAKLKTAIKSYKKYDQERKQYYSDVIKRLGELESYIQEIEDSDDDVIVMKRKILNQTQQLRSLERKIEILKTDRDISTQTEYVAELLVINENLKKENKDLQESLKFQQNLNDKYYNYLDIKELLADFQYLEYMSNN